LVTSGARLLFPPITPCTLSKGEGKLISAAVHFSAAAVTDRGRKRPSNEDAFGFSVEHGVYLVCDGMGGAAAGEIASSLAVDEVLNAFEGPDADLTLPPPLRAEKSIQSANHAIYSRSRRNYRLQGMGTTVVMLVAGEGRLWALNVGDSRCYRLRQQQLEQVTQDHSLVEEQIRDGRMTRSEAMRSPLRNVITRALGTQGHVTADVFPLEVEVGDLFLLSSDGLTRELSDTKIQELLNSSDALEDQCKQLVEAAKKSGGNDNITCLLLRADA